MEAFEILEPYIEYVHIKDASAGKRIVPAGHGIGQVEEILGRLLSSGWNGFLSLEPHLTDFAGLQSLEQDPRERRAALSGPEAWELALNSLREILSRLDGKGAPA